LSVSLSDVIIVVSENVIAVGIQTGFCSADTYIAFLNGSVVFHLHHLVIIQQQLG
jgi:hypothetical protein